MVLFKEKVVCSQQSSFYDDVHLPKEERKQNAYPDDGFHFIGVEPSFPLSEHSL